MPDTQAGRTAFLQSMTAAGERLIEWARIERNLQSREMPALRRRIAAIEREARAQGEQDLTTAYNGGPSAEAAHEVRRLSGMSIDQIAALFPDGAGGTGRMSRENYHRWLSGRTAPSDANLERLLGLQNLLREVAARVDDVRSWLLTPTAALDFEAPYGVLRRGALSRLWRAVSELPVRHAHPAVTGPEGDRGVRISESLRSTDAGTPADEMDDGADWFDS